MNFGSLFAGIGGMDLGLERAGITCKWQVEIDLFCQRVLAKHWPNVRRYRDVKDCGRHNLEPVDLIAGGFPCQPHSVAGKRKGAEDDRNLWPEFLRIVKELRPTWVLAENVPGIVSLYLDTVLAGLESEGYTCWTFNIPACAVGAYHRRERIFIVAYRNSRRREGTRLSVRQGRSLQAAPDPRRDDQVIPNPSGKGLERGRSAWAATYGTGWLPEPDMGRVVHGFPSRVDRARIKALGNAVVPQVAEWIGKQIIGDQANASNHRDHRR